MFSRSFPRFSPDPLLRSLSLFLLAAVIAWLPQPTVSGAFLVDAPADPVVDDAHLLSTEQGDILRELITETAKTYELHVYIWTSDVASEVDALREATRKVHHWAPSGYVVLAHFSSVQGVKPVLAYSQDIMVKLTDEQKAAVLADMIEFWNASTEPSEKILMAGRRLIRNQALWEGWFQEEAAPQSQNIRSVSFSSGDITQKDGETIVQDVRRTAPIGGNADKVQQHRSVFFDWQKQVMAVNAFLVTLIIGGAVYAFLRQRRASLYREEQMRRGAELLTPLEPARRRPPME